MNEKSQKMSSTVKIIIFYIYLYYQKSQPFKDNTLSRKHRESAKKQQVCDAADAVCAIFFWFCMRFLQAYPFFAKNLDSKFCLYYTLSFL